MSEKNKQEKRPTYSLPVRITCIALAALVSSGILVYLITFLMQLFAK